LPAVLFLLRDLLVLAHSGARFDRERWRFGGVLRRAVALLAMTGVSWKGRGRCREVHHPEPFLTKRPTPPEEGNEGDYNLKGMLLFRGLLRRTCVLLAMTRVSWKGRGRCREVHHPEPFLTKSPTPP